jgi:NAD-dependent dihydropyrimidine dehydrogenase PreA subunit
MGMFIAVEIDDAVIRKTDGLAKKIVEVCPVKIFAAGSDASSAVVVEDNVDECTLCDLCTDASPDGVTVTKLYD